MLKYTRNSVIAFDFGEALSFEGETGPYVQYAAVRARNILRKLEERGETLPDFRARADRAKRWRGNLRDEDCWQLLLAASKVGFGDRARGGQRRAGARGSVRVPTGAGVQQLLSRISGAVGGESRRRRRSCCG